MKILLDECVPTGLRKLLEEHDVFTATECGWSGIKNGELLKLASAQFEVFVTVDKNLSFQQNPTSLPIPVIVLHSGSNKLSQLKPLVSPMLALLRKPLSPTVLHVGI